MKVSKDFRDDTKAALIKRFDKKVELDWRTLQIFIKWQRFYRLWWFTDTIEHLTVHISNSIPTIHFCSKLPGLKRIDLVIPKENVPRAYPFLSILDILVNGKMDAKVTDAARALAQKIKGTYTRMGRILREGTLEVNAIWTLNAFHGLLITNVPSDKVMITTNLMGPEPVITGSRAQLDSYWIRVTDGNGTYRQVDHFLRHVWAEGEMVGAD